MFNPGFMVIKMSKVCNFFVYSAAGSKTLLTLRGKCLSASERSY